MSAEPDYQSVVRATDTVSELRPYLFGSEFRDVMSRHPAAIVVITCDDGSRRAGFTAATFFSLSLDPPLVAFAVGKKSSSRPTLLGSSTAIVHLLSVDQHELAVRFATQGIDRFAHPISWTRLPTGETVLCHAASWLRCELERFIDAGDHDLVVARPLQASPSNGRDPLVYHNRNYHALDANPLNSRGSE